MGVKTLQLFSNYKYNMINKFFNDATVFFLLLGCTTANFGLFSMGQPHLPNFNHCIIHFRHEGHLIGFEPEPSSSITSLQPTRPHVITLKN